uniref:Uncharacterized protein n=1 Tax=Ditylenchus dipsaci TaxID=166011 RepID=A0A915D661_9BILA
MNFSYVMGFYALSDSTLVILDQNMGDNTLRQRVISIQHAQLGLNGERAHVVLFAKDPSIICSRRLSSPLNISDLLLKLDEFVSSEIISERICDLYKFFSHGDSQLCFFIASEDGRLVVTDEGKMRCACISLSDETMTIREIQMCLKMNRSPDSEDSFFCVSKRASSNVICASISVVFPVPLWFALLAIGSRLLTWLFFMKYIYKPYIWDVRHQPSTIISLSLPQPL